MTHIDSFTNPWHGSPAAEARSGHSLSCRPVDVNEEGFAEGGLLGWMAVRPWEE